LLSSAILFNTGKHGSALNASTGLPYIPFNDQLFSADADHMNSIIPAEKNMTALIKDMEQQKPVIEKQLKLLAPLINEVRVKTETITKELEDYYAMPVAVKENDAARQIIIKEESSGSNNASVKVFYLVFENGQWVLKPEWMLSAKEISPDSFLKKMDTSAETLKRILPQQ